MGQLENMSLLARSEETFRLVNMLQLLLQSAGTVWPALQQAIVDFFEVMLENLAKLR